MARVYTSRQLLDPYFVQMRQQADNAYLQRLQDQRNRLYDSLEKGVSGFGTLAAGAVGLGIDLYKKGKRKDQINQYKDEKAKQRASELDALKTKMANETDPAKLQELTNQYNNLQNMPLFDMSEIGAMNDYVENADSSKFLTLRQIKEANDRANKQYDLQQQEKLSLAGQKYDLAKQMIDNETDPAKKMPLIQQAITYGIEAKQDVSSLKKMLSEEQQNKKDVEQEFLDKKGLEEANKTLLANLKDAAAKLENEASVIDKRDAAAVEDFNQRRSKLQADVDANAMTKDVKVPSAIKTIEKPSVKDLNDGIKTGKYTHKQARNWGFKFDDELGEYR